MAYGSIQSGAVTSISAVAANQMPEVDRILYLLKPHQTPLFQWVHFSNFDKAEVVRHENGYYQWFEDEFVPISTTLSTGITGGASSEDNIGLTDGTIFASGDILLVELTEQMVYVDSVASSEVDITHIDGSTNITAAASGTIRKIGSRNHELATARTAMSTKETEKNNYNTIFSETVYTSGRYQSGEKWTNKKTHKDQILKKTEEMKLMYEDNYLFSTAAGTVTVSSLYRFTYGQGFLGRVTTNATSHAGALSEEALDDYLKDLFERGSMEKFHYAGGDHLVALNKIVKDRYQIDPKPVTKTYGVDLYRYVTPFGDLLVKRHPRMTGKFSYYGFSVDPDYVKLRYQGSDDTGERKFRIEENTQTPGTDGKQSKLLSDQSAEFMNEEVHGILYKAGAA